MSLPELHFKPRLQVIDDDQIQQLHMASLELLERTGVKLTHPEARELLDGAGARIHGERVHIPAWLVEDVVRKTPPRLVLGQRDGRRTVFLEGSRSFFGTSLDCIEYLDPLTDQRRPFTIADCRVTATVTDALPNYDWTMIIGMAADVPADIADRTIVRQALSHCRKPLVFCCKDLNSLKDIYAMGEMIAGDGQRFRQAPFLVHYSEAISPLLFFDPAVDKLLFCARNGIPVICLAAPMAGSTGPATFAGNVMQGSAESLAGQVLVQLAHPGAAYIYGAQTTIMDMSTTIYSYGAPEKYLMIAAVSQLAQHYRVPFFGTAGCSDAKFPDPQAAAEAAFACLSAALSGANLVHDSGWLDHGCVASPAYMVLVHELLHMVKQYMRGLPVNDETLALDIIDRVGPGGHFLHEDHTMKHFKDVWYSQLFDRSIYPEWLEQGSRNFEERLRAQTRKVMAHTPPSLAPEINRELDRMAEHWR
jgi:trimethylamine---corrinoid protein Co-methyltransferase